MLFVLEEGRNVKLEAIRDKGQFVDRLVRSGKGIINSQNIFRFPGTQRFLVNHPDTFPNDLRKLFFIGNRDDSLNRSVAQRLFQVQDQAVNGASAII